jgi:hypothetical protein
MIQTSLREQLADGFQFPLAFRGGLGICHFHFMERIQDNLGNSQAGVFLIVGGNDVPGRVMGACRAETGLIRLHVLLPIFPLMHVRQTEFPVLVGFIDALEEPLSLLFLREVKEKLDDPGAVTVEVLFQVPDGAIPLSQMVFSLRNSSDSPWPRRISGWTRTTNTSS